MQNARVELADSLAALRARAVGELRALPASTPYPVVLSDRLVRLTADVQGVSADDLRRPLEQHGRT